MEQPQISAPYDTDLLNTLVSRVFKIEDFTLGDPLRQFVARYRGHLYNEDSAAAYDQLSEALRPHEITPLFRVESGRQTVYLMRGVVRPKASRLSGNIIFFLLSLFSVLYTGAVLEYLYTLPPNFSGNITEGFLARYGLLHFWTGWPFALSLMSILLAHEFGHYLAGRYHKAAVSLPYFLPLPFPASLIGTLGAFIQLKEHPRNRRVLVDIGAAGPLAGLVVAIPVLLLGLSLSRTSILDTPGGLEGNSILYLAAKFAVFGRLLPDPVSTFGQSPLVYWVRYFFTGAPFPVGATDVFLHPVAWAGWVGLLVTFLNLIPLGTLDGGHIIYALFGPKVKKLFGVIEVILIGLGFLWIGWWLWAALLFMLGRAYAEPYDQITTLDTRHKIIGAIAILVFILVLTPVPFT
ncbi:MAG: site-2 protease family protein [Chloroflexota bacterium]